MDSKRFNELTKALASGQSRRNVAKGLAAGLVGGVLGMTRRGEADAARKKSGPGTVCREQATCDDNLYCLEDQRTHRKKCTCVEPNCYNFCVYECQNYQFNHAFNHAFNQIDNCEDHCAGECQDSTCYYYFNQRGR